MQCLKSRDTKQKDRQTCFYHCLVKTRYQKSTASFQRLPSANGISTYNEVNSIRLYKLQYYSIHNSFSACLQLFYKNVDHTDFDQHLECAASEWWSKFRTHNLIYHKDIFKLSLGCLTSNTNLEVVIFKPKQSVKMT